MRPNRRPIKASSHQETKFGSNSTVRPSAPHGRLDASNPSAKLKSSRALRRIPASIRPSLFWPKPYQPSRASVSGTEDGAFVLVARGRSPDIARCERRGPGYVRPFREMLEPCRCRRKCCGFKTQNSVGNCLTSGRHLVPSPGGEECLRLEFSSTLVQRAKPAGMSIKRRRATPSSDRALSGSACECGSTSA